MRTGYKVKVTRCFLLPITNNEKNKKTKQKLKKQKEAGKKNGAGGDEKHFLVCLFGLVLPF